MAQPPQHALLERFSALCEDAFVDGAADALEALARLATAAGESPALYAAAPDADATTIQMAPAGGVPALPPGWATAHPAAAARLLGLGPPLIVGAGGDGGGAPPLLALSPDLAAELERVKSAVRRQAHATLGARKRAALADAIAQVTDGASPLSAAWAAAPTDQAALLSRTLGALALLAAQPGGLPVAAPLLSAVVVALDTALALSSAAATAAVAAPYAVALLLDDAVLLEVSSSPAVIAAVVGWLTCAVGLVPDAALTNPPLQLTAAASAESAPNPTAAGSAGGAGATPLDAAVVTVGGVPQAARSSLEPLRAWRLQPYVSDATLALTALTLLLACGSSDGSCGSDARHHGHGNAKHAAASSAGVCAHPPAHPRLRRALQRHLPGGGGVSATVQPNWQCFAAGTSDGAEWTAEWFPPIVYDDGLPARHWAHQAASAAAAPASRRPTQHPYLPHVLTHRVLLHAPGTKWAADGGDTLPLLLQELRALAEGVKAAGGVAVDPTLLPFLRESAGSGASHRHKGHLHRNAAPASFAAPGVVTLAPASAAEGAAAVAPEGPHLAAVAALAHVRHNADGRADTARVPVPLRDAAAATAAPAGGHGSDGASGGRSGWCPALLGGWW